MGDLRRAQAYFWVEWMNKAGYTAITSRGRVGRGGNAGFSTFRLVLTDGPTNQRTDGRTDGRTDKASYRVARPRLKRDSSSCTKFPYREDNKWALKLMIHLKEQNSGWAKNIVEKLSEYNLASDWEFIRNMTMEGKSNSPVCWCVKMSKLGFSGTKLENLHTSIWSHVDHDYERSRSKKFELLLKKFI